MSKRNSDSNHGAIARPLGRRRFLKQTPLLATQVGAALSFMSGSGQASPAVPDKASGAEVVVETTFGKVRGTKRQRYPDLQRRSYGASTAGTNRFMPPRKPVAWTGTRDALGLRTLVPQLPGFKTPEIQMMQNLARTRRARTAWC